MLENTKHINMLSPNWFSPNDFELFSFVIYILNPTYVGVWINSHYKFMSKVLMEWILPFIYKLVFIFMNVEV
jgi:hypothetical protein